MPIIGPRVVSTVRPELLDESRSTLGGVFAMSESQITDRVRFDVGGRFTVVQAHIPDDPLGYDAYSFQDTGVVFHAGLLTFLTEEWNVSTSVSQGFRAPNLEDLTGLTQGAEGTDQPNPELTSEESVTVDLGTRLDLARLRGELFVFATTLSNMIAREPTGDMDPDNTDAEGRPLPFNRKINAEAARIVGVEAKTEFWLTGHLALLASGTWILSKDVDHDTPLRREPPTRGRLAARYQEQKWRTELYANWALAQDRLAAGDLGDERICPGDLRDDPACPGTDGYVVLGARGDVEVAKQVRLGLAADNLLDRRYKTHGSGVDRPGLNVMGTARATF
jgi:outer membrane receptor protein involved in Fe transport